MTITSGKGKKEEHDHHEGRLRQGGPDAPKNVELTQSKKEAKAPPT